MHTLAAPPVATPPASITPRDIRFDVDGSRIADWNGGDVISSTWSNALSLQFPIGERFFIASVAAFKNAIEHPEQAAAVKAFVTQEGLHTREHLAYNQLMRPIVDVDYCERKQEQKMAFMRSKVPPIGQLAITVAAEHFTAILAHDFLQRRPGITGSVPSFERLWVWHAIEECEHKSVAFDVYAIATEGKGDARRYRTMMLVTFNFLVDGITNCYRIFKAAGTHTKASTWAKLGWYLLGKPGILRRVFPAYLKYYRSSFHPSQIDDTREMASGLAYLDATA